MHFIPCRTLEEFSSNIPSFSNADELWNNYRIFKERWWAATLQSPEILVAASHALMRDAKIIEVLGEFELVYIKTLYGGSESPPHRRADSRSFRLYEVAGMSHRETRYLSMADKKRLSVVDLEGAQWSTFANSFLYHALFDAMNKWITTGVAPPRGTTIDVDKFGNIERDEYGNALAGVRTVHIDVPTARIVDVTPQPHPHWHTGKLTISVRIYFIFSNLVIIKRH